MSEVASAALARRVLVAKVGLDGHDRGAKVVCRILRDAGMVAIYSGLRRTVEEIADIALQEGVDVVGLSVMSGGSVGHTGDLLAELGAHGVAVPVVVGGVVTERETAELTKLGVRAVVPVGAGEAEVLAAFEETDEH